MGGRRTCILAATVALGFGSLGTGALDPGNASGSAGPSSWAQYHGGGTGAGVALGYSSVDTARPSWTSPALDGELYGEPLVEGGLVYVATEADVVYALSAATGAVRWARRLGEPVPSRRLPCGNISTTVGVTGTPVIDPSRDEIFAVADVWTRGGPAHYLVGLSTSSGRVEVRERVDTAGTDPAATLQRTGLALDQGRVVFGLGGNYGDCGQYRGRVVSVPESGGPVRVYSVDAAGSERQGAIWMGGAAPVIDASGDVWVEVGNGSSSSPGQPYDHSDSVLELTADLRLRQFFAPTDWASENGSDQDFSTAPALVGNYVVASGKDRDAYLLARGRLGGIGHPRAVLSAVCAQDVDGGVAVLGATVVLPCQAGPVAVAVVGARLVVRWRASAGGGPPIVVAGRVWTIGGDGVLYGLDARTGAVVQRVNVGALANHFPTPGVGDGLLLVATSVRVVALRAP